MIKKVISGGQTGVDLGALEAAKEVGMDTGGTAPPGFMTEEGVQQELLESYGLEEGEADNRVYIKRTIKNADDGDATLTVRPMKSFGTDLTVGYCQQKMWTDGVYESKQNGPIKTTYKQNYVIHDLNNIDYNDILKWVEENNIETLNIAGPRESKRKGIQEKTKEIVKQLLTWPKQEELDL